MIFPRKSSSGFSVTINNSYVTINGGTSSALRTWSNRHTSLTYRVSVDSALPFVVGSSGTRNSKPTIVAGKCKKISQGVKNETYYIF